MAEGVHELTPTAWKAKEAIRGTKVSMDQQSMEGDSTRNGSKIILKVRNHKFS